MKTLVVIPARMDSSRFPGKPLAKICGREMILHVLDRLDMFDCIVATPDQEIATVVRRAEYGAFITRTACRTGMDRVVEVSRYANADIYINVQGDEPLINPDSVGVLDTMKKMCYNTVVGAVCKTDNNVNDVKVMLDDCNNLTSMSRVVYKQVGIYAVNGEDLRLFGQAKLPDIENIELLRFKQLGLPIRMAIVEPSQDVNVPEDVEKIERLLCQRQKK